MTPGTSASPNGTLGTSAFLSTDSTGSTATSVTTPTSSDTITFVAESSTTDATSGSGGFTIGVSGTQTVAGITLRDSGGTSSSLNGDVLTLGSALNSGELDIGASGITLSKYNDGSAVDTPAIYSGAMLVNSTVGLTATQTWTNNSYDTTGFVVAGNVITASGATTPTNLSFSSNSNRTFTISGNVNIVGTLTEIGGNSGSTVTLSGVIGSNVTGVNVMTGAYTNALTLTSASSTITNAYTGTTSVTDGTLVLSDTNASAATATGSLTGTSVINVTGSSAVLAGNNGVSSGLLTVTGGGQITPGTSSGQTFQNVGTLHLGTSGGVTLTNAVLNYDLNSTTPASSDRIFLGTGSTTATGALTLGTVKFNFENSILATTTLPTGTPYVLIVSDNQVDPSSITTSFLGNLASSGYTATYSDVLDGNGNYDLDVTFSTGAVPEPSTWVGACLTVIAAAWSQRKRLGGSYATLWR